VAKISDNDEAGALHPSSLFEFACPKDVQKMPAVVGGHFCDSCERKVSDLSQLTAPEAARVLREKSDLCVSYRFQDNKLVFKGMRKGRVVVALASFLAACEPSPPDAKHTSQQEQRADALVVEASPSTTTSAEAGPKAELADSSDKPTKTQGAAPGAEVPKPGADDEEECEGLQGEPAAEDRPAIPMAGVPLAHPPRDPKDLKPSAL
jgi:hypothetical protein